MKIGDLDYVIIGARIYKQKKFEFELRQFSSHSEFANCYTCLSPSPLLFALGTYANTRILLLRRWFEMAQTQGDGGHPMP